MKAMKGWKYLNEKLPTGSTQYLRGFEMGRYWLTDWIEGSTLLGAPAKAFMILRFKLENSFESVNRPHKLDSWEGQAKRKNLYQVRQS